MVSEYDQKLYERAFNNGVKRCLEILSRVAEGHEEYCLEFYQDLESEMEELLSD